MLQNCPISSRSVSVLKRLSLPTCNQQSRSQLRRHRCSRMDTDTLTCTCCRCFPRRRKRNLKNQPRPSRATNDCFTKPFATRFGLRFQQFHGFVCNWSLLSLTEQRSATTKSMYSNVVCSVLNAVCCMIERLRCCFIEGLSLLRFRAEQKEQFVSLLPFPEWIVLGFRSNRFNIRKKEGSKRGFWSKTTKWTHNAQNYSPVISHHCVSYKRSVFTTHVHKAKKQPATTTKLQQNNQTTLFCYEPCYSHTYI